MSNLEEKFKKAQEKAMEEINVCLDNASAELDKAVKISEKYGIPFGSKISFLYQTYRPMSFHEKWKELVNETDDIYELLDFGLPEDEGWEHSMVC